MKFAAKTGLGCPDKESSDQPVQKSALSNVVSLIHISVWVCPCVCSDDSCVSLMLRPCSGWIAGKNVILRQFGWGDHFAETKKERLWREMRLSLVAVLWVICISFPPFAYKKKRRRDTAFSTKNNIESAPTFLREEKIRKSYHFLFGWIQPIDNVRFHIEVFLASSQLAKFCRATSFSGLFIV